MFESSEDFGYDLTIFPPLNSEEYLRYSPILYKVYERANA